MTLTRSGRYTPILRLRQGHVKLTLGLAINRHGDVTDWRQKGKQRITWSRTTDGLSRQEWEHIQQLRKNTERMTDTWRQ